MIFVRTMARMSATVFPLVALLFMSPPWLIALAAPFYIVFLFLRFAGPYGLMLHANGHRPIFSKGHGWLEYYVPWVLGPLLGHSPTSFDAHHLGMHHAENNMAGDGSSTLAYVRDDLRQFIHYWARFFFTGHFHVPRYLYLRRRYRVLAWFVAGEAAWLAIVAVALWVNWAAALVVFVLPMLIMRVLLMCGNFAQHAFIDVDNPDDGFGNSTCLTNTSYNHAAYNDGYHIVHHVRPGMHWSEMAAWYEANVATFAEKDAVVFDGIQDNIQVWLLLMMKDYDRLAKHLVDFQGRSHDEKVAFLKGRVRRTIGEIPSFLHVETLEDVARTKRRRTA